MKTKIKITDIDRKMGVIKCVKSNGSGWDTEVKVLDNPSLVASVCKDDVFFVNDFYLLSENEINQLNTL